MSGVRVLTIFHDKHNLAKFSNITNTIALLTKLNLPGNFEHADQEKYEKNLLKYPSNQWYSIL